MDNGFHLITQILITTMNILITRTILYVNYTQIQSFTQKLTLQSLNTEFWKLTWVWTLQSNSFSTISVRRCAWFIIYLFFYLLPNNIDCDPSHRMYDVIPDEINTWPTVLQDIVRFVGTVTWVWTLQSNSFKSHLEISLLSLTSAHGTGPKMLETDSFCSELLFSLLSN